MSRYCAGSRSGEFTVKELGILFGILALAAMLYAAMKLETTELFVAVLCVAVLARLAGVPPGALSGAAALAFILRYTRYVGTRH